MNFCHWYPLRRAAEHAPPRPGMFQIRVTGGLLSYPKGKSAMVHYELAADLAAATDAFARAHPEVDWLCRHAPEDSPEGSPGAEPETEVSLAEVEVGFRKLFERFVQRFGAPPTTPKT